MEFLSHKSAKESLQVVLRLKSLSPPLIFSGNLSAQRKSFSLANRAEKAPVENIVCFPVNLFLGFPLYLKKALCVVLMFLCPTILCTFSIEAQKKGQKPGNKHFLCKKDLSEKSFTAFLNKINV